MLLLASVPALVMLAVLVAATRRDNDPGPITTPGENVGAARGTTGSGAAGVLIRDDSPTIGPADAPVTIVEFLDPECESCRAAHPEIKRLLTEYAGRVRLVVRYFPLHTNSMLAVHATEAAGEQGKYWEMQDLLFTNQPQWGEQRTPQTDRFIAYARSLGLDIDQFTAVLQGSAYSAKVERDRQDGAALGVRGTPTIFVNGQQVRDYRFATLQAAVEAALKAKG